MFTTVEATLAVQELAGHEVWIACANRVTSNANPGIGDKNGRFHGLYDKSPAVTGPRGHVKQVPLVRLPFFDPPSPGIP
jgi:hypothetical protein